ncbi:hypothetical protein CSAL01_08232 [Colletotrichum salicis]|uniref:Uncharacterized protein n=1 Tax=Colletotrichum salicis TaxID=1209931 RepID=A0A135V0V1_9PEZI|nr:hypothetical protein CSAL01_08232 [Colletotrichum salicis]
MASHQPGKQTDPIGEAASKGRERKSFFSCGDEGLKESVGAAGRLLRITQPFPGQKTGLCVDNRYIYQRSYTFRRLKSILKCSLVESVGGIGPCIDSLCSGGESDHDVVNNRWPTFTRTMPGETLSKLRVSYVAFQGTIYQIFEIIDTNETQLPRSNAKKTPSNILRDLSLDPELFIRETDFVDEENVFNTDTSQTETSGNSQMSVYTTSDGETKNHIKREHKGHSKHFSDLEEPGFGIQRSSNDSEHPVRSIVLAYTLRQCPVISSSDFLPDWKRVVEADGLLRRYEMVKLIENPILDFCFRRNLEHILYVCSIPVSGVDYDGIPPIALTCGDVDGHRVAAAASFYAFQCLLLGLDRITALHSKLGKPLCMCGRDKRPLPSSPLPYVCMMKRRIEYVCKGHMKWVLQRAVESNSLFCPNYWTNGDEIENWESSRWLPGKSLVDAPFQFIKAAEFCRILGEDMPDELMEKA